MDRQQVYERLANTIPMPSTSPYIVAISGKDASGKTMFADGLAAYLHAITNREIIRISADDFMNERSVRRTPTASEGETCYRYTFNFDAFKQYVLVPLQQGGSLTYKTKVFDYGLDQPMVSEDKQASADAIIIIDGVFLFKDDLVTYWSLKVLLEVDDATAILRGATRDTARVGSYEAAREAYINRYIVSQAIYYAEANPLERADIVIDNTNYQSPKVIKI